MSGIGIGVVGDEFHVKGLGQSKHLGANVAHANRAQGAARQARANVIGFFCPSTRTRNAVFDAHLVRQHEHESDGRNCHRAAHTIGRNGEINTCLLASGHIDGVVTHTKPSNQLQARLVWPKAFWCEAHQHGANGIVTSGMFGPNDRRLLHVLPYQTWLIEPLKHLLPKDGLALTG